jgi:hypothetical protein
MPPAAGRSDESPTPWSDGRRMDGHAGSRAEPFPCSSGEVGDLSSTVGTKYPARRRRFILAGRDGHHESAGSEVFT